MNPEMSRLSVGAGAEDVSPREVPSFRDRPREQREIVQLTVRLSVQRVNLDNSLTLLP